MSVHGRALVALFHGKALCLVWSADEGFSEFFSDWGAHRGEPVALDRCGCSYNDKLPDGVYIGALEMIDDGPSDWGYGDHREYAPAFDAERLATQEEWQRHLDDEWPWDFEPTMVKRKLTHTHRNAHHVDLPEGWEEREPKHQPGLNFSEF